MNRAAKCETTPGVTGSIALLLVTWLGPPVPAPSSEPQPAPEPTVVPEPPQAPLDPADLPPLRTAASRPLEIPFDGGGALATGGIMLVSGVAMMAGSILLATEPLLHGEGWLGLGAGVTMAGGAGVLAAGVIARRKFRATELGRVENAPTTGRAMHAGSAIAMSIGSLTLLTGTLMFTTPGYCSDCAEPPTEAFVAIGVGPGLLVAGSIMFIVSQVKRTRYRRWMEQSPARLRPRVSLGPTTMQIALTGRF